MTTKKGIGSSGLRERQNGNVTMAKITRSLRRDTHKTYNTVKVIGYVQDVDRAAMFAKLRFICHDGERRERLLPRGHLRLRGEIREILDPHGVNYGEGDLDRIVSAHTIDSTKVKYGYSQVGWRPSGRFGMPGRVIHENGHELEFMPADDDNPLAAFEERAGDLKSWNEVAVPAIAGSSFAIMSVGVPFGAAVFRFSSTTEGVTFAFSGDSGVGKTSCCVAAQAVMGSPERHLLPSWDGSRAGLKDLLGHVRDFALVIDDTSRDNLPPGQRLQFWADIGHAIAGGGKRNLARSYQAQLGAPVIRRPIVALTSGEISPEELAKLTGETVMGGVRARFIDIPVPPKDEGGAFDLAVKDTLPGDVEATAHAAAQTQQDALADTHGVAFGPFLDYLEAHYSALPRRVRKIEASFVKAVKRARKGDGKAPNLRIARKFGLVLAGLILAIKAGALAITPAAARRAVRVCFDAATRRQDQDQLKRNQDVRALKTVLRDRDRVPLLKTGQRPGKADLGFLRDLNGARVGYMRADQIGDALDLDAAGVRDLVGHLARRRKLLPGTGGDRTRPVKVGDRQIRHYAFPASFFAKPKSRSE